MLRVIKWAYNLGVRNERHRIAGYLSNAKGQRYDRLSLFEEELRVSPVQSEKDAINRNIELRQKQAVVDNEVIDIISGLFHSEEKYERGASFMFPNEKEL